MNPDNPPKCRQDYIIAAHELASRGLTPRDIGQALRLTTAAARELLRESVPYVRPERRKRA
jgi:hypothetical protein